MRDQQVEVAAHYENVDYSFFDGNMTVTMRESCTVSVNLTADEDLASANAALKGLGVGACRDLVGLLEQVNWGALFVVSSISNPT